MITENEEVMLNIAQVTGLTYRGRDDSRLFVDTLPTASLMFDRDKYNEMQEAVNTYTVQRPGFNIYAINDTSGYTYWARRGENNYIDIVVNVTDPAEISLSDLIAQVNKAIDFFVKYVPDVCRPELPLYTLTKRTNGGK